jgi:uncharacterized protein YndB with AHSA1/START domain
MRVPVTQSIEHQEISTSNDTPVEISRVINDTRDRVHAAWADLETAKQWWGPQGLRTEELVTELRLTHESLPDQPSLDNHAGGWNSALNKLADLFATPSESTPN